MERRGVQTQIIYAINNSPLNRGLDGCAWLSTTGNIPITFENGNIVLFDDEGEGIYQIHVLFNSRGREAIIDIKEAFRRMFIDNGAQMIMGLVPDFRRDVKMLARWAGMKSRGLRNTSEGPCELFVLSKAMWGSH
jgi:hypothetical protein